METKRLSMLLEASTSTTTPMVISLGLRSGNEGRGGDGHRHIIKMGSLVGERGREIHARTKGDPRQTSRNDTKYIKHSQQMRHNRGKTTKGAGGGKTITDWIHCKYLYAMVVGWGGGRAHHKSKPTWGDINLCNQLHSLHAGRMYVSPLCIVGMYPLCHPQTFGISNSI